MSEIILRSTLPVPAPKETIKIRPGTIEDIAFMDRLQKKYSKNLAFLPRKALEGKIKLNQVLIAESSGNPVGYLIGQDQYFKRDELGIIYHLAVDETRQRGFVGASLIRAQFEKSAYGCKLYCCWCAQDLEANHFYESLGFVPLAFRAGSEKKQRIHLFWQKRIREGDTTTPWWFPCETKGGLMKEDRIAFPIPPGKHWSDQMPIILPRDTKPAEPTLKLEGPKKSVGKKQTELVNVVKKPVTTTTGKLHFIKPRLVEPIQEKPKKEKKIRQKMKNDPEFVSKAREFRDRYLEKLNQNPLQLESAGKYDLVRKIGEKSASGQSAPLMLAA